MLGVHVAVVANISTVTAGRNERDLRSHPGPQAVQIPGMCTCGAIISGMCSLREEKSKECFHIIPSDCGFKRAA